MKKLSKILFVIISVFCFTEIIAEEDPTLIINEALCREGSPYNVYRIFYINGYGRYIIESEWKDFFKSGAGKDFITIDELGYIESINEEADLESISSSALEYIKGKGKTPAYNSTSDGDCYSNVFELHTEPGYYLIESPKGKASIIVDINPKAEINEKNIYPVVKSLFQTSNGLNKNISVAVGEEIEFVIEATLSRGINDRLYIEEVPPTGVSIDKSTITITGCETSDYEVKTSDLIDSDASFGVNFKKEFLSSVNNDNTKVEIRFKGKISKDADIRFASYGLTNIAAYYYKDDNDLVESSASRIYTWYLIIETTTGTKENEKGVSNVHYKISKNLDGSNPIKLVKLSGDGEYRIATDEDEVTTTDIVNKAVDGDQVIILGLKEDKYFIFQTKVPLGFVKYPDSEAKSVILKSSVNPEYETLEINIKSIEYNLVYEKFTLPSTGSKSRLIMITIGILLIVLSLCSIIYKSRIKNN